MMEKRRDNKGRVLRNGESQRSDGRYMFRYTDSDGVRRTVYSWKLVNTDYVADAKKNGEALRDIEKRVRRDIEDKIRTNDASSITLNMMFESYMESRKDLKETTRYNYFCLYKTHIQPALGMKLVGELKYSDIQRLYTYMFTEMGLKASTVQSVHSIIVQVFNMACRDRIIRTNPSVDTFKILSRKFNMEQNHRPALTREEQVRFINYIRSSPRDKRLYALFVVLLGTGMRIGEALGLRWCDCDFKNGIIHVTHTLVYKPTEHEGYQYRVTTPKTRAAIRDIPMLSDVKAALLNEKKNAQKLNGEDQDPSKEFSVGEYTGFIFLNTSGKVFTPSFIFDSISRITKNYNKAEKLKAEKEKRAPVYLPKFSAHILRHTFCTRVCESGVNIKVVQDVMGHKNINTTMDVYNEATAEYKKSSFEDLEGKIKLS